MKTLLHVRNLSKQFGAARAVDNVSFDVYEGETLGLVGESGSGKSTTGRMILRLLEPTSGGVAFDGADVLSLRGGALRAFRRRAQMVFQDPFGSFNPRMTIRDVLGEALLLRGVPKAQWKDECARFLELVQMPTNIVSRFPHEFSGGQRQRIGIARALAVEPQFLVADEPVSALDVSTQAEIVNLLLDLQEKFKLTMLFVSHDLAVVKVLCDRVIVMQNGKLVESAPASQLFSAPQNAYTRELLAAVPSPDPELARQSKI